MSRRVRPAEKERYAVSANNQFLLLLTAAFVGALACGTATCTTTRVCESKGTCIRSSNAICGFSNRVGVYTDVAFNADASVERLSAMLRGLCSPGDRTQLNPSTNEVECVPYFPFPSAVNTDIMDADASSPAGKACGKWIKAGGISTWTDVTRRGKFDNDDWARALRESQDAATKSSRVATSAMAKFRSQCSRIAIAGPAALRSDAVLSYEYMKEYIDSTVVDRNGVLKAMGFQTSHGCSTNAGVSVRLSNRTYKISVRDDWLLSPEAMSASLYIVGESIDIQTQAQQANHEITELFYSYSMSSITESDMRQILMGASGLSNVSAATFIPSLQTSLIQSVLHYYDSEPASAVSYLKGVSAFCSYLLWSPYFEDSLHNSPKASKALNGELSRLRAAREPTPAMGRLNSENDTEEASPTRDIERASGMKLSQVITGDTNGNLTLDCFSLMTRFYANDVDAERFKATISDELYARLQPLVLKVRLGAAHAAASLPIKDVLLYPDNFTSRVMTTGLRITGAPRGSWAGIARPIPNGHIASTDGMFTAMLKQWRAQFHDYVVEAAIRGTVTACDHNPLYSSLVWNAYMLKGPDDCSVLFLGMAHRPLMDAQYDDVSLLSRAMFVVAHEFAHVSNKLGYNSRNLINVLQHYHTDTYSEAIADLIGALSILYTGLVNRYDFLTHFCQVWCSRVPLFYMHPPGMHRSPRPALCVYFSDPQTVHSVPTMCAFSTRALRTVAVNVPLLRAGKVHPSGNDRCNFLVYTLNKFYPDLAKDVTTRI